MNNSEAKRVILESDSCFCKHGAYKDCHSGCKYREALDAAVKALEQEPTTKNDLGVDAVSRDAVLDLVADYDLSMGQVVRGIHALPSVTPQEPKTGHKVSGDLLGGLYCSECMTYVNEYFNYCPHCGCRMVEPQESEDKE